MRPAAPLHLLATFVTSLFVTLPACTNQGDAPPSSSSARPLALVALLSSGPECAPGACEPGWPTIAQCLSFVPAPAADGLPPECHVLVRSTAPCDAPLRAADATTVARAGLDRLTGPVTCELPSEADVATCGTPDQRGWCYTAPSPACARLAVPAAIAFPDRPAFDDAQVFVVCAPP